MGLSGSIKHRKTSLILCLTALGVIIYGILMQIRIGFDTGVILVYIVGIVFMLLGLFIDFLLKHKWILCLLGVAILAVVSMVAAILISSAGYKVNYDEDALIVLGAGLDGAEIVPQLRERLDTAIEYIRLNPDAVIVVSGGQGGDEEISEAEAMEKYLINNGIPQNSIIKEDKSTSTYTNLYNTKQILDDYFDSDYSVAIVTNRYHTFRADKVADALGINHACLCADTPPIEVPIRYLREFIAILKYAFDAILA